MSLSTRATIKLTLFIIVCAFFITGFVINITSDEAMYNTDENLVPIWQQNVSSAFITWMNVVSYCMDPTFCAGYITLIWLLSNKKLEILVFLNYYLFVNWLAIILKSCIR